MSDAERLRNWIESVARQASTVMYGPGDVTWEEHLRESPDNCWTLPKVYLGGNEREHITFPCKDLVAIGDKQKIIEYLETEVAIARVKES